LGRSGHRHQTKHYTTNYSLHVPYHKSLPGTLANN
jgi:hypothetical protein